jgi:phosphatidyl-myo-inositol dimannoside synthase
MTEASRPRVLMLTSTLPRWDGDSEPRFVLDLAKQLSEHFEIELLAPHTHGAARSEILDGVQVTRFRYWFPKWESVAYHGGIMWRLRENPARILQLPLFLVSLAWHIVRRLRREPRIDLIHAHWLIPQGIVAVLVRRLVGRRVPVVTTSHGGDLFGLRGRLWRVLKRKVLRDSEAVTVVSHAMAEAAIDIAGNISPFVIPMGTNLTELFTPLSEPRLGSIKNLIFVGRLVEKKGVKYLLEALAIVLQDHPEIRLCIVGHGPLRSSLELAAEQLGLSGGVLFAGPVPHHQLPKYYQQADMAVFPFVQAASGDQEGFGLVMVEAMGSGCPVIATKLPAVQDVVQSGITGILVTPGDSVELARAICSAIDQPEKAFSMAEVARVFALQRFDWAITRARFSKVFELAITARN